MIEIEEAIKFEHNGFACTIIQRPDLCFVYQVHGFRESDEKDWIPKVKFDKDLSLKQIEKAAKEMMDGTFSGEIEVYGNLHVWCGE